MGIVAFTSDHVRRLTGLSKRQLGYWDETDFFSPTIGDSGRRVFTAYTRFAMWLDSAQSRFFGASYLFRSSAE